MIRNALISVFTALMLVSCSTDFDINGDWQEYTIVYGLVNQNDSITWIKINKAFLGDGDVLMMAQNPDSSEYAYLLDVKLEEWSNGSVVKTFYLDTCSVYNKEPGLFYYPKQILYKAITHNQINKESTYKLHIVNPKTGKTLTSQTDLVYPFDVIKPKPSQKIIDFSTEGTTAIEWKTSKNGRRYQLMIRFNYKEVPLAGGDTVYKSTDWLFPSYKSTHLEGGEELKSSYSNPYFYDLLLSQIPVDPTVKRFVGKKGFNELDFGVVEFIFSVAADEFSTYLDVYEPSTGLVQNKPDYTNISGGLGIFSSRSQVFRSYKLGDLTKTRIKNLGLGF